MTEIFRQPFSTPYNSTPFGSISEEDFLTAIPAAIDTARKAIDAIATDTAPATFDNTILALEHADDELQRVLGVFGPLQSAMVTDRMSDISQQVMPMIQEFNTEITLDERLWRRVKAVYDSRESLGLDKEDRRLLEQTYLSFKLNGALLEGENRKEFAHLRKELVLAETAFRRNIPREMNALNMPLSDISELDGLPARIVDAASEKARELGGDHKWVITIDQPTYTAFMRSSPHRHLRERLWRIYNGRNVSGENDNTPYVKQIAGLQMRIAQLLGYGCYADLRLQRSMAGSKERVMKMLGDLAEAYRKPMESEMQELREFAGLEGFAPWDYAYYANLMRRERLGYDEEALRPYFPLPAVVDGVFGLATQLYGITFRPAEGVEVYHPEVDVYEVTDADGSYLGLLYTDFFPRATKRPGAWMTEFAEQWVDTDGTDHRPHISIVMNFTRPTADAPALLSPDEVRTFLHEFGHALHGLLSRVRRRSLSGTNVFRDFVELPSQLNENFLTRREFLDTFARHYITGEPISDAQVQSIVDNARFGVVYACMRQLNFGMLDIAWYTITSPVDDAAAFEQKATAPVEIFAPQPGALISPAFSHIFGGGYSAGYYSYKWSEMLDADAFEYFIANESPEAADGSSPLARFHAPAMRFRKEVLERGDSDDPAELYRRFRGADPSPLALLRRDGLA